MAGLILVTGAIGRWSFARPSEDWLRDHLAELISAVYPDPPCR